ncbi:ATP-dependent helicase HrpB [Prauserella muralis]|uniref:ATP-dependent helicase HrpB n=1 Tax=Prauserella muralis TaxID=588067 RepID=A0A2V4BB37_9PSEU|nr:ATP-dependent helicase HrpB [Prauserella muralis]PXY32594.1 ATP-dependent helicase HrpB [Prauserella muralis]TWE23689.1 ATP-dependent helicase HrpB [Prauserella muralis]
MRAGHLPALPALPVRDVLDDVRAALDTSGTAVLVAPPGTGKTTLVPLALADGLPGRVVVAEPRRLAARAAASRMAALLGEPVGETVGYAVRGERRTSARTRIEVVTSGLLVRRLQGEPELPGVSAVLLDECHERHLDADLLLALLLDVRGGLRDDLRLLATSATVAAERLAALLGDAPVVTAHAKTYPVRVVHTPPARGERIEGCVARAVRRALAETDGDVLAFLPGAAEIARVAGLLDGQGVDVYPLHGRLSAQRQDAALTEGPRRRVVLATAVAESSLTVPGVRAVVDSGLARVPRVDHRRDLPGLATVRVSAAVAEQRAGRAGRQGPGTAYRCWPEGEHASLPAYPEPEIRTAELSRLALELACWSTPDGSGLAWWDPPPEGALTAGRRLLRALGAVDPEGVVTDRGRRMAALGLHPRLARALLDGAREVGADAAAEMVALLDTGARLADVDAELRRLRAGGDDTARRWRRDVRRLKSLVKDMGDAEQHAEPDPAVVVALAHPERLARRRADGSPVYLMASGTAAELPPGSGLADAEWLAVAEATREPGRAHAVVRLAARADERLATHVAASAVTGTDEVRWSGGDIVARSVRRLGAITLAERPLRDPAPGLLRAAAVEGLRAEGLGLLRWSEDALRLRQRLAFLHERLGSPWPDVSEAALLSAVDSWLEPELSTVRRRADLGRIDAGTALRTLLPWPAAARLDELAPDRLEVPSGSRIRVDYQSGEPVLAVKLQETFGWRATPLLAGGRVPVVLHLLSPAGRPAAVTSDLESFWRNGYPEVRAELRGRYPKHPWPDDPLAAEPTRRTKRRPG